MTATAPRTKDITDALEARRYLWPPEMDAITPGATTPFTWNPNPANYPHGLLARDEELRSASTRIRDTFDMTDPIQNMARGYLLNAWNQRSAVYRLMWFRRALTKVNKAWQDYAAKRAGMDRTFEALNATSDQMWNAAVLTLHQAQDNTLAAAEEFDRAYWEALGNVAEVVRDGGDTRSSLRIGHDAYDQALNEADPARTWSGYVSPSLTDYRPGGPLTDQVRQRIEHQRTTLASAAQLMPPTT